MQSDPHSSRPGSFALRTLFAAALAGAAVWLFVAGFHFLPRPGQPADAAITALYCAVWIVASVIAIRLAQRAAARRRRLALAEASARQFDRLAQLTGGLAAARTPVAAAEAALLEPMHALGASAGLLALVGRDNRIDEVVRTVGYGTAESRVRAALTGTRKTPAADAIVRGAPVLVESAAARTAEYGRADPSFGGTAAVPLLIGSRVVAVLQLDFSDSREFSPADREYLLALGLRAAQAFDRTWELDSALTARAEAEALRARADQELQERQRIELALRASETRYRALAARTSRLHWFAAALSESATLQAVGRAVVEHGRNVLGAASGEVAMLADGGGALETIYSDVPSAGAAASAAQPFAEGLSTSEVVATRGPVLVRSFEEWQERYPRSAAMAADGGYVSSAALPLLVDGAIAGIVTFNFTAPVNFDDEYSALLASVAQHCAQAIHRATLYEAARRARADAENANRQKDEFVSMLSHDLRAPLNAILGWTAILRQGMLDASGTERALQSIADNATRQQHLVEELLDFSRIRSGRLALAFEDVDVRTLLRPVVESNIPVAASRGLTIEMAPVPPIAVRGDRRRLEQVFFNLVGNALKFTPEGGRIGIVVNALPHEAEIRITDTGAGIAPEFLPHVFDAFRQADEASGQRHGGVGLGLSIARELVDAHKGHIRAESDGPGRGATFIVTLPADPVPEGESATVH